MKMTYTRARNLTIIPSILFGMGVTQLTLDSTINPISNTVTVISIGSLILLTILNTLIRYIAYPNLVASHSDKSDQISVLVAVVWILNLAGYVMWAFETPSVLPYIGLTYLLALLVPIEALSEKVWRKIHDR